MNKDKKQELADIWAGLHRVKPATSRADELIACLEGEVKSRDARIAELEEWQTTERHLRNLQFDERDQLRAELALSKAAYESAEEDHTKACAELAAIKAQEPADGALLDDCEECSHLEFGLGYFFTGDCIRPLYAAPVAKQVVMPERVVWIDAHHIVPGTGPALIGGMCLVSPEQLSGTQVPLTLCRLNAADQEGGV